MVRRAAHHLTIAAVAATMVLTACAQSPGSSSAPSSVADAPGPSSTPDQSPTATPASTPTPTPPAPAPTPTPPPGLEVSILQAEYGILSVSTRPGASCTASAVLSDGTSVAGLGGARTADNRGVVVWTYLPAPVNASDGTYTIQCSAGSLQASATATFQPGD